jgi:hemerythrin superfamily protein
MNAAMKETRGTSNDAGQDAIAMLKADHKKVKGLFADFEKLKSKGDAVEEKSALVTEICQELTVHAELEEAIFYPAVREAIKDEELMKEAELEHAAAKDLIAQLEEMDPEDELYNSKVTVLGEQIDRHVEEEEGEMFVKAKKSKVDTDALGAQMANRKSALMAGMGSASEEDDEVESDESDDHEATPSKRASK